MIDVLRAQVPLLRERGTDTAALCVNCDAYYANGVLVTKSAVNGSSTVLQPARNDVTPAAGAEADVSTAAGQPGSASRLGPPTAANKEPSGPSQQSGGRRHPNRQVEDTSSPAPRVIPPVAIRLREPVLGWGNAQGSRPAAGVATRPATAPHRDAAGAAGPSAEGLGRHGHVAAPEAAGIPAQAGSRTLAWQPAAVFGATEPPLPRFCTFLRSADGQPDPESIPPGGNLTSGGEAEDGAEDDDADAGCEYSPTADPRLGPFARDPADRAPVTPDRCLVNLSSQLQRHPVVRCSREPYCSAAHEKRHLHCRHQNTRSSPW